MCGDRKKSLDYEIEGCIKWQYNKLLYTYFKIITILETFGKIVICLK